MFVSLAQRLTAAWPDLVGFAPTPGDALDRLATRAVLAAAVSFLLAIGLGPRCIAWLRARYREPVKSASAEIARLHAAKRNTPTMGGLFLIVGLVAVALVLGDGANAYLRIALVTTVALCALGAADDWIKLRTVRRGLTPGTKLAAQAAIALAATTLIYSVHVHIADATKLTLPLVGSFDMGWWFVPWAALVIVGASNAVNLTDGLDGLAGGCLVWASGALAVVAYVAGDEHWSAALGLTYIPGAAEMSIACAALAGCMLAFLWFNCHPASVFMGDAGSLPLGGLLGLVAVIARQELLFVLIGGVFVVEALSVIVQVISFRWWRRRVLLCAPLHHHFQLRGWAEDKIVVRFWIAAGLCAVVGVATLIPSANQLARPAQSAGGSGSLLPDSRRTLGQNVKVPGRMDSKATGSTTTSSTATSQDPPTFAELF
jgi:phospho-N-acetylmuramoyl-pentapeptide-transferase